MFVISAVLLLVGFFCFLFFVGVFLELETTAGWFFQRVQLYLWAVAGHEPGILSI